jgi:universal stress protein A
MTRTITRILVPTDFSATSDVALDYAIAMAKRFGASLQVLHVVDDPFVGGAVGSEVYITNVPAMRVHLVDEAASKLVRLLPQCGRVAARTEVRVGKPADVIRDVAEEHGVDLIVMGTHGRTGMAHLLLGSVAEKIVREAPCPVLTVRGDPVGLVTAERELFNHELVPTE